MKTVRIKNVRSKLLSMLTATALVLPMATLQAADRHASRNKFTVYADVISAEPIYREVAIREPREECWTEEERYVIQEGSSGHHQHRNRGSRHGGDALVGGVIGGVIGNQIGRNGSRGARAGATVAGAIIGSVIANEAGSGNTHRRNRRHSSGRTETVYGVRPVKRCRTLVDNRYEQRIDGYNVTYEHRGRRFQTRTRRDPGPTIELRINVEPVVSR